MLVKIFGVASPEDVGFSSCASPGLVLTEQLQCHGGGCGACAAVLPPGFDVCILKPFLATGASPWSELKPPASKICFSLLSAIILLEVVCSSSGPGGHGLKIADLDRYLKKSSLLTLLGFIFLQCGYLVLPYSHHIICSSNMVNKCS